VNRFLKSLFRLGLDLVEQSERTSRALRRQEDHTVRHVISFTAGMAVGVGIGILLAPESGEKARSSIAGKIHGPGAKVRGRFSPEKKPATGTEGK
jgi:F0F1-type ATP synthase assembly protein I